VATVRRRNASLSILRTLVAGSLAGTLVVAVPLPVTAQGACDRPVEPQDVITAEPWERRMFGFERVQALSQGAGVTVAVIDSGVDTGHPQLDDGQIVPGLDLTEEGGTDGRVDCVGHGTGVASIIVASEEGGVGFAGLAPGARILPIRVAEQDPEPNDTEQPPISPDTFAQAVREATDRGADIINASIAFYDDFDQIRSAIQYAVDNGVIVVAAAGNLKAESGPDPVAYPAGYEPVVSVGAITQEGARYTETYVGPGIDLLAPGADVTVAWPGEGHVLQARTSFATPFVSAAAALVLAENPGLTATEVVDLLKATADPGPGSAAEDYAGIVNPYRALTGRTSNEEPVAIQPPAEAPVDPVAQARAERWERNVRIALLIVLVAVSLTVLGFMGAGIWRRGRRHRWLPGQRRDPVFPHAMVDEPERAFYTIPTPRSRR
jgi:membrane-anchored mycosin MYCP